MKPLIVTILICAGFSAYAQDSDSSTYYFDKAMLEKEAGRYLVAARLFENPSGIILRMFLHCCITVIHTCK
jgi:hypothetical protein